ncbi:MAG: hypothetical protein IID54_06715, partial [Proteobacteria bacterium]|nr:hypothetical protein [Pseudomonadota bacterium]
MPHALFNQARHTARILAGRVAGLTRCKIYFITESRDWVIRSLWGDTLDKIRAAHPAVPCAWHNDSRYLYNQIVHYGSIWKFAGEIAHTHSSNRIIANFYHGHENMAPAMRVAIDCLRDNLSRLSGVLTACELMAGR